MLCVFTIASNPRRIPFHSSFTLCSLIPREIHQFTIRGNENTLPRSEFPQATIDVIARFQTMVDCLEMIDHDRCPRRGTLHLRDIVRGHDDRIAHIESRPATVHHDHLGMMVVDRVCHCVVPDRVARKIQRRLAFSRKDESRHRRHRLRDLTGPMLRGRPHDRDPIPDFPVRDRSEIGKTIGRKPIDVLRLTKEWQRLVESLTGGIVEMIPMKMRHQTGIDPSEQVVCRVRELDQWIPEIIGRVSDGRSCPRSVKHGIDQQTFFRVFDHKRRAPDQPDLHGNASPMVVADGPIGIHPRTIISQDIADLFSTEHFLVVFRQQPKESSLSTDKTKFLLDEDRIPTAWYNIAADLPEPLAPPLHPGTHQPIGPEDLAPLFPMSLIAQEVSTEREIEIPDPVRDIYRLWRPTPLYRAARLEKALDLPSGVRIFYKYEGTNPAGSHKPNTAVPRRITTRKPAPGASRPRPAPANGVVRWRWPARFSTSISRSTWSRCPTSRSRIAAP